ncbi:19235_t:CDS:1, partial [Dentiscutata erythropus]
CGIHNIKSSDNIYSEEFSENICNIDSIGPKVVHSEETNNDIECLKPSDDISCIEFSNNANDTKSDENNNNSVDSNEH